MIRSNKFLNYVKTSDLYTYYLVAPQNPLSLWLCLSVCVWSVRVEYTNIGYNTNDNPTIMILSFLQNIISYICQHASAGSCWTWMPAQHLVLSQADKIFQRRKLVESWGHLRASQVWATLTQGNLIYKVITSYKSRRRKVYIYIYRDREREYSGSTRWSICMLSTAVFILFGLNNLISHFVINNIYWKDVRILSDFLLLKW